MESSQKLTSPGGCNGTESRVRPGFFKLIYFLDTSIFSVQKYGFRQLIIVLECEKIKVSL